MDKEVAAHVANIQSALAMSKGAVSLETAVAAFTQSPYREEIVRELNPLLEKVSEIDRHRLRHFSYPAPVDVSSKFFSLGHSMEQELKVASYAFCSDKANAEVHFQAAHQTVTQRANKYDLWFKPDIQVVSKISNAALQHGVQLPPLKNLSEMKEASSERSYGVANQDLFQNPDQIQRRA